MKLVKHKFQIAALVALSALFLGIGSVSAITTSDNAGGSSPAPGSFENNNGFTPGDTCGDGKGGVEAVQLSINVGCQGKGNPIIDMTFAFIRFLSNGVGIIIIGSIIYGGIRYTTSAGDPQKAAEAIGRIRATLIALVIFIFAYPILNYILPAGFFK